MRSMFALAMLLACTNAVKINRDDKDLINLRDVCDMSQAEKSKYAMKMYGKADTNKDANIDKDEFIDFMSEVENVGEEMANFMKSQALTFLEMDTLESMGLSTMNHLTINEFEHALDCKFGIPRVEY
jgi:hypothetical protein